MTTADGALDLDALAARLRAKGYGEFVDFFISNRADGTLTSSELMCLSFRDGRYRVWYRDMGQDNELCLTEDPHEAERVFVHHTRRLVKARYPRRRWPEDEQT
ncbi:hypothetical protein [Aeromicrobium chenweiae]|uniref:Uncharacterized protein n=1 Tax=Aeromicrobium chenweiae TaxID=2079793 RepID=A0A2S0WQG7_9ACTN|nr:hypothetical protein [Aeromicrobium chenweiae]AWB93605.1 hypothetical protein C3E78_16080 [Aeromicrobium chenweiae]TGN33255.1 hypothetical protein E4L97_06095 [Aeromicrobium chenweiae]